MRNILGIINKFFFFFYLVLFHEVFHTFEYHVLNLHTLDGAPHFLPQLRHSKTFTEISSDKTKISNKFI